MIASGETTPRKLAVNTSRSLQAYSHQDAARLECAVRTTPGACDAYSNLVACALPRRRGRRHLRRGGADLQTYQRADGRAGLLDHRPLGSRKSPEGSPV